MSNIVAILPARSEGWILGLSARALLMWVDSLIICDHASTDSTPEIISALMIEYGDRVHRIADTDPTWREMQQRQRLLEAARFAEATHVVIIDADEVVSGNLLPSIRRMVECTPRGQILQLPWLQMAGSIDWCISTGMWSEQSASISFVDLPEWHWAARNGYDHHHRHPMGRQFQPVIDPRLRGHAGLMHLQMASGVRLRWKQFHYKLVERLRWPDGPCSRTPEALNKMYDPTVNNSGMVREAKQGWWEPYAHLMQYLHLEAEPWQRADALRIMRENPGIEKGLTDFGCLT